MTTPTSLEIRLPVEGSPVVADCFGVDFGVTDVEWRTYIYGDRAWVLVTAHGFEADGKSSNCRLSPDEDAPEWLPRPPEWFFDVARDMRIAMESPEIEASLAREHHRAVAHS